MNIEEYTNKIQEKIGKEEAGKIADDIANILSYDNKLQQDIKNKQEEITKLQKDKEMLIEANGNLLQQVAFGKDESEFLQIETNLEKNEDVIEAFTMALYRGQQFVMNNSDLDVAEAVLTFFSDSNVEDLEKVIGRYRKANVWCDTPYFGESGFELLMDVMAEANELDKRAPFEKLVNNKFSLQVTGK